MNNKVDRFRKIEEEIANILSEPVSSESQCRTVSGVKIEINGIMGSIDHLHSLLLVSPP